MAKLIRGKTPCRQVQLRARMLLVKCTLIYAGATGEISYEYECLDLFSSVMTRCTTRSMAMAGNCTRSGTIMKGVSSTSMKWDLRVRITLMKMLLDLLSAKVWSTHQHSVGHPEQAARTQVIDRLIRSRPQIQNARSTWQMTHQH